MKITNMIVSDALLTACMVTEDDIVKRLSILMYV